ncbi:Pyruvate, water dikinase [uncultured Desulfobacterium sp.]|uniref:Phosphoenolpyruvate synthase n=1 Tax=uncultured Desulfobacterium sp. TaxID=201089 RepID=A0A445MT97_9BACT|nr:Pyruvate, water dikinase [uncultured Desulfobacterium sp.]
MEQDRKKPLDFDYAFRLRYETLRALMNRNVHALQLLSDLEADLNHFPLLDYRIKRPVERLLGETLLMIQELNLLARNQYTELYDVLDQIRRKTSLILREPPALAQKPLVAALDEEQSLDPALVGGKASGVASLRRLFPEVVPAGFTVTTAAYNMFLQENGLVERIRLMLKDLDTTKDRDRFSSITESIRNMIRTGHTPKALEEELLGHAERLAAAAPSGWAVRSSATSEDSRFSFAGQFDTSLGIPTDGLIAAYRQIVASRFSDRAVIYRINCGFREVDTPMAVLFMPMIDAAAAGVIYTTDPKDPEAERMVINACAGLGDDMVKGIKQGDTFYMERHQSPVPARPATVEKDPDYISSDTLSEIGTLAYQATTAFGFDMDIEWAVDRQGKVWLLQGRRLYPATQEGIKEARSRQELPLIEGGVTIFPGRAEGQVVCRRGEELYPIPKGSVLVVDQPTPELSSLLPNAAALLASGGSPVGHLATLIREFSIPSIFQLGNAVKRLQEGKVVSVNATKRRIYAGSRWPGMKERVLSRLASAEKSQKDDPLNDIVLALHLTDPFSSSFKPRGCRSIHDVIRFTHEMSVRQMFQFGDEHNHLWKQKTRRLKTKLPMKFKLLDLEGTLNSGKRDLAPADLDSIPFNAFWKGFSDPALHWPERWKSEFAGLPTDFREQVLGGFEGPRRSKDANYLLLARDYLNFNARFAYHYTMVDAFVGPGDENNYVHFRFHGGGGSKEKRQRRARFVEWVLREKHFGVDRRGDLITAWLRRYPQKDSEEALEMLGRLMVCARQLDMLMRSESSVKVFAQDFLNNKFQAFS